ncbi:unnamed protein product [Musa acuminata subsp. malaccensis]|uniref:(wild Malaysian banana) hypothetical protein n=1 Tax=Musa acuminata subsp. malaccensis TaxID=214687 RepID=A0A8D7F671_MUSAM|nr:unnamed protein product [Musa acuminata subsp. malaccensis]
MVVVMVMVMVMVMVVVVVMVASAAAYLAVDGVLNVAEVLNAAGDGDGPRLVESVLRRRLVQKLREERVAEVRHRHHEPLLLLAFRSHPDRHAPPGRRPRLGRRLLLPLVVVGHAKLQKAHRSTVVCLVVATVPLPLLFFSSSCFNPRTKKERERFLLIQGLSRQLSIQI